MKVCQDHQDFRNNVTGLPRSQKLCCDILCEGGE